jgi:hypothetical protein
MRVVAVSPEGATLVVDELELMMVNNALNELFSGVRIFPGEFHTRVGATGDEVRALLDQINSVWLNVVKERKRSG